MHRALPFFVALFAAMAQDPQFDVQSRLVLVPTTVMDARGGAVDGLAAKDFTVLDNGVRRDVVVDTFATGVAPISLVVAVQAAGISRPALEKIRKIGAMIRPLVTGERGCAGVLQFAATVRWIQECTSDEDKVAAAFERLRSGEEKKARMVDGVMEAVNHLSRRQNTRRVVVLISESRDRGSETDLQSAVIAAQAAGVTVYAITYSVYTTAFTTRSQGEPDPVKRPRKPSDETGTATGAPPNGAVPQIPAASQQVDILGGFGELIRLGKVNTTEVLLTQTGGAAFSFKRQKGLEQAIQKLGQELHTQYLLSFTPGSVEPGYHRLVVTAGDYVVRARPGYWR